MRWERARAYTLVMHSAATHSDLLDQLVAALQSGRCDEAGALRLYQLGPHAVTLALLSAARRIAEQDNRIAQQDGRIAELQTQAGRPVPSTPSGIRPSTPSPARTPGAPRPAEYADCAGVLADLYADGAINGYESDPFEAAIMAE